MITSAAPFLYLLGEGTNNDGLCCLTKTAIIHIGNVSLILGQLSW